MAKRLFLAFSLGLLAVAALAGCGSSGKSSSTSTTMGTGGESTGASVNVAKDPTLGSILVDAQGRALYLFQKDMGGKSSCSGSCSKVWPPEVAAGKPTAGSGVSASKLGTVKRSDGTMQITYAGHPLYTYSADASPGQVNGNGINSFGGIWNAVQPSGAKAPAGKSSGSSGAGGESGGESKESGGGSSGGGYGY